MLTDLSSTVLIACVVLLAIGAWFFITGRRAAAGALPRGRVLGLQTPTLRSSRDAWDAGHAAAAPFLERYGRLIFTTTALTILSALFVDWLAAFFYVLALVVVGLGLYVCLKKANTAAAQVIESYEGIVPDDESGEYIGATRIDEVDIDEEADESFADVDDFDEVDEPHERKRY